MGLGCVHTSEPLRRLSRQDAVGEHARRVPHAHPRCSSRHVGHEPPDMCALGRVAPLHQRRHTGRMQAFPLNHAAARQHAAARCKGERACISTLREPARREEPKAACAPRHHVSGGSRSHGGVCRLVCAREARYQTSIVTHHRLNLSERPVLLYHHRRCSVDVLHRQRRLSSCRSCEAP